MNTTRTSATVLAFAAASAVAFAALTFVATATASSPTSVDEAFHRSIPNFISCPGFSVRGEFDVSRTVTTFYDENGSAIRQVTHVHFTGTLTNSLSGKTIDDAGNQIVSTDLTDGTSAVLGRVRVVTIPGEGEIFAQVGRLVRDGAGNVIFSAGQQDGVTGNFGEFCAYMATP
jgi:hypothetical protein